MTAPDAERTCHCQNYMGGRGDIVVALSIAGAISHQVRYSAYGVPASVGGMPASDTDFNGRIVGTPGGVALLQQWP